MGHGHKARVRVKVVVEAEWVFFACCCGSVVEWQRAYQQASLAQG